MDGIATKHQYNPMQELLATRARGHDKVLLWIHDCVDERVQERN